jgi:hypothetical protein
MKKLLQGSIALLLFSISIMIFQASCKKDAVAATTATTQAGLILYQNSTGGLGLENYDGTNPTPLNITLPTGLAIANTYPISVSPDHKNIFFTAVTLNLSSYYGYACNIDGSNVRKIDNSAWHFAAF